MTDLVYPDSLYYTINNVYYWPYRGWEMASSLDYPLARGEYRYFRFNISDKMSKDAEKRANAACVWLHNMSCYELEGKGSYFCEGFLEPQCEGVTLGHLVQFLFPSQIEVATDTVWQIEEITNDLDDFLDFDYHKLHPVVIAGPDEKLLSNNFYPMAATYKGKSPNSLDRVPPVAKVEELLGVNGMGFYQPYPQADPVTVSFILDTANKTPTPRELKDILRADYVVVNANPLDADEQRSLQAYDKGENVPDAVVRFFESSGKGISKTLDIPSTILGNLNYIAYAGIGLGLLYGGIQVYRSYKGDN